MTVEECLRQTGFTDAEIKAMDQRAITGFTNILNEATTLNEQAQQAKATATEAERRYTHMYQNEIVPSLNQWGSEKATLTAERDFYRSQNEGARTAGFISKEAPSYSQT